MKIKGFRASAAFIIFGIMFLITSSTYAIWDRTTNTQNKTVDVGVGTNLIVSVEATPPDGKSLVPTGSLVGVNDVEQILLTYKVRLSKATVDTVELEVTPLNVAIGGNYEYGVLVNIAISSLEEHLNNSDIIVSVIVTLNIPNDFDAINEVVGKTITFDLNFNAKKVME